MGDTAARVPVGHGAAPEAETAPEGEYTGKLYRGAEPDSVWGWLVDRLGYRLEFKGTKDYRRKGGYLLIGQLAHIPAHLRQPAIDC